MIAGVAKNKPPCAMDYWFLVKNLAARFVRPGEQIEDTEEFADGLVGLTIAINKVREQGVQPGTKFVTLAYKCIRNHIINGIRERARNNRVGVVTVSEYPEDFLAETKDPETPSLAEALQKIKKYNLVKKHRSGRHLLYARFLDGKSWAQLGRESDMTRAGVRRKALQAARVLKEEHAELEGII